jgi:hypothetical protein
MGKFKGEKLGQFVPMLYVTIESQAWKALSHGAKALFIELKKRKPGGRNRAFLSFRQAEKALGAGPNKIREWFAELQHYRFIELISAGCLGVDGRGKAPHWRIADCGDTSRASADGLWSPPRNDFLSWDGVLFDPKPFRKASGGRYKKQNPATAVSNTLLPPSVTPPLPPSVTPYQPSATAVRYIEGEASATAVSNITSLTTLYPSTASAAAASNSSPKASKGSKASLALVTDVGSLVIAEQAKTFRPWQRKKGGA